MKKNGFTLVELLAVLAILAILALLITPTVFNSINKFRNDSNKKQISLIESAASNWASDKLKLFAPGTYYITIGDLKAEGYLEKKLKNSSTNKDYPNNANIKIEYNGKRYKVDYIENSGTVNLESNLEDGPKIKLNGGNIINLKEGQTFTDPGVIAYSNTSNNITSSVTKTIKKNNVTIVSSIDVNSPGTYTIYYAVASNKITQVITRNVIVGDPMFAIGNDVYFDPTGKVTNCSIGKEWTPSRNTTTCYKWYVIKDNGNSVEILLDHNTTEFVVWNSTYNNTLGPKEVYNQLKIDTTSWNKVEILTSSDNLSIASYTINYNGMKSRLITAQEVANLANLTSWKENIGGSSSFTSPKWLYANISNIGYWTATARTDISEGAWYVHDGLLGNERITVNEYAGVRPVARVLKSNF